MKNKLKKINKNLWLNQKPNLIRRILPLLIYFLSHIFLGLGDSLGSGSQKASGVRTVCCWVLCEYKVRSKKQRNIYYSCEQASRDWELELWLEWRVIEGKINKARHWYKIKWWHILSSKKMMAHQMSTGD